MTKKRLLLVLAVLSFVVVGIVATGTCRLQDKFPFGSFLSCGAETNGQGGAP